MHLSDANSSSLVEGVGNQGALYVVMPMRLSVLCLMALAQLQLTGFRNIDNAAIAIFAATQSDLR